MTTGRTLQALLTGGSGFIGRRLRLHLTADAWEADAPTHEELDLLNYEQTRRFLQERQPRRIFHLASAGVFSSEVYDPALVKVERTMAANLVAAAAPGCRVIFAGSMAEYGRSGRHREDDDCTPRTAYGHGKYQAGQVALERGCERGIGVTVARLFGVYGPGEGSSRLFPHVLAALRGRGDVLLSDGRQRRDFVHIDDVCRALIEISSLKHAPPILNVGTGQSVSVRDAVTRVVRSAGADPARLKFGALDRSPNDEDYLEADTALLEATLGWTPVQRLESTNDLTALCTTVKLTAQSEEASQPELSCSGGSRRDRAERA